MPYLLNGDRVGMETCTVNPWPHQIRVADTVIKRFPERFMLCDEVGLGKTIEAGLAIRQLVLSGAARRVLILVVIAVLPRFFLELHHVEGASMWPAFNDDSRVCEAQPQLTPRTETFTTGVETVTSVLVEIVAGSVRAWATPGSTMTAANTNAATVRFFLPPSQLNPLCFMMVSPVIRLPTPK